MSIPKVKVTTRLSGAVVTKKFSYWHLDCDNTSTVLMTGVDEVHELTDGPIDDHDEARCFRIQATGTADLVTFQEECHTCSWPDTMASAVVDR